jgi:hypothetical protein
VNLPVDVSNPFPSFVITVVKDKDVDEAALGEVTVKATTFPKNRQNFKNEGFKTDKKIHLDECFLERYYDTGTFQTIYLC